MKNFLTQFLKFITWPFHRGRLLLFLPFLASGQITLENSKPSLGPNTTYFTVKLSQGDKYAALDLTNNVLNLYSADHSLFATFNIPVPPGYAMMYWGGISDHLFNSDDNAEMYFTYYKTSPTPPGIDYKGMIIKDDGSILWALDNCKSLSVVNINGSPKMLATLNTTLSTNTVEMRVYSLPGTTTALKELKQDNPIFYPNPASETINFLAAAKLFDLNGKEVAEGQSMNVSELSKGTYIYISGTKTGRVIIE